MTDLSFLTATELAPLIKSRQLSPVELVKHLFHRIDELDPVLHTYITPLHESALTQARNAEMKIMQGPL